MKYEYIHRVKFAIITSFAHISNAKCTERIAFQYAINHLTPFLSSLSSSFPIRNQHTTQVMTVYRGADKSLARPGR